MSNRGATTSAVLGVLALFLLLPGAAHSTPGDIDPTFGEHGSTLLNFGDKYAQASAMAIDSQGRIVAAGTAGAAANRATKVAVARLTPDGAPDTSFSGDGTATVELPAKAEVDGVAVDGSGRIVVGGSLGGDLIAIRLNSSGEPDSSFSSDGVASLPAGGTAYGGDVVVPGDGSVAVGGSGCDASGDCHFAIASFGAGGAPNTSFSGDGLAVTDFPSGYAAIRSMVMEPDGTILAGGLTGDSIEIALARYRLDGELDPSFGNGGQAIVAAATGGAQDIALDSQGRILALGVSGRLVRVLANGTIDPDWTPTYVAQGSLALDSQGKIVIAGSSGGCSRFCDAVDTYVVRLLGDGTADPAFTRGLGVYAPLDLGAKDDGARAVALDSADRPVVAGFSGSRMVVARIETDPGPDDRDGDGVDDAADFCPTVFGVSNHKTPAGCPNVRPKLTLKRRKKADLWVGAEVTPDARCSPAQVVTIYRKRKGTNVALTKADSADDGSFEADGNLKPGVYFAAVTALFEKRLGRCGSARSKRVVIHE